MGRGRREPKYYLNGVIDDNSINVLMQPALRERRYQYFHASVYFRIRLYGL